VIHEAEAAGSGKIRSTEGAASGGSGEVTSRARCHAIAHHLLAWTQEWLPDFPWNNAGDAYAVWVAVVMLQQTQVATALPFYHRFLARFPAVRDLAAASLGDVLKAWEGLGYYARARNLHAASQMVMERHGSALPADRQQLMALPGIGEYTAGAILSIALGQDEPAVDGNVRRVLCRLFAVKDELRRTATQRSLWDLARRLLPSGRAGVFNQGMMHLGSVVCRARRPKCVVCPLAGLCEARRLGLQDELPRRSPRQAAPHYDVTAAVVWGDDGRLLIARRLPDDMLGGMWEFPGGRCEPGESLAECLRREIREELGLEIEVGDRLATVPHAYSHFRVTLHAFYCCPVGGEPQALQCAEWRWVQFGELPGLPFPIADQRIIAALKAARARVGLAQPQNTV
jgi:A/G-specific adenine glycosylase